MKNKINDKILSIPPYISTCWSNVVAVYTENSNLMIGLNNGTNISIPLLLIDPETETAIFHFHAMFNQKNESFINFLQHQMRQFKNISNMLNGQQDNSLKIAFGSSTDQTADIMSHNPDLANSPLLPKEVIYKIAAITKIISPELEINPQAEEGCNCFHCQIVRELTDDSEESFDMLNENETQFEYIKEMRLGREEVKQREVKQEEKEWLIKEVGERLYSVRHRTNDEEFKVSLANKVMCSCGHLGCPHIVAVLKS